MPNMHGNDTTSFVDVAVTRNGILLGKSAGAQVLSWGSPFFGHPQN